MKTNVEWSLVTIVARVRCRGWLYVPVLRTFCVLVLPLLMWLSLLLRSFALRPCRL